MSKFIQLTYLIETSGSPEKLAHKIASDQSTGTFVPLPGETEELKNRVAARVVALRPLPASTTPSFLRPVPSIALKLILRFRLRLSEQILRRL
jgi:3-oxoisoapionate-4-phosphate decarboxylase